MTTQKNVIKKTYDKRFAIPLDFDFFKHPVYPYGHQCNIQDTNAGDTNAIYKIIFDYDAIFNDPYVISIREMYIKEMSIPYTKVTSIHYQALSKKDIVWKIDINNLSVQSLQGLLLLFLDKHDDFAYKNEEFYNPSIKKILMSINGMPHQLYG